jgi:hypothetical protein
VVVNIFLFVAYLVFEICLVVGLIYLYYRMMPKEILKLMGILKLKGNQVVLQVMVIFGRCFRMGERGPDGSWKWSS